MLNYVSIVLFSAGDPEIRVLFYQGPWGYKKTYLRAIK